MWRAIWIRLTEQKADYAAPFERSSIARITATISALGARFRSSISATEARGDYRRKP